MLRPIKSFAFRVRVRALASFSNPGGFAALFAARLASPTVPNFCRGYAAGGVAANDFFGLNGKA